jgi:hypothetical protein
MGLNLMVLKDWVAIGMSNPAGRIATMYSLRKRGSSHTHSTLTEEATMLLKVRRIVTLLHDPCAVRIPRHRDHRPQKSSHL